MIRSESGILLWSIAIAFALHSLGLYIVQIKDTAFISWKLTKVTLLDGNYISKSSPPKSSIDKKNSIPSFVSLPGTGLMLSQKNGFNVDKIQYHKDSEEEDFFNEAKKMISEEEYFFSHELDSEDYLPIAENHTRPDDFLLEKIINTETSERKGIQITYRGANRVKIESKFSFFAKELDRFQFDRDKQIIILVSFNENFQLVNCQIDRSSGNPELDKEVMRLLKATIIPSSNTKVNFRGQLIIKMA
ncbi:MAG: hypothetical protein ACD_79C00385G0006 [uncultured bacterium]|nr:MAG: hypothetical protein ACD_79C00385G0006 [uncultured bacterium]